MTRRLINLLTVLSLLVGLGAALLWIRSTRCVEEAGHRTATVEGFSDVNGYERGSYRYAAWGDGWLVIGWSHRFGVGSGRFGYEPASGWFFERVSNYPPDFALMFSADDESAWFASGNTNYTRGALAADGTPLDIDQGHQSTSDRWFRFPLALIVGVGSILPVLRLPAAISHLRAARRRRGLCVSCGYDLTGNVTGVCPECGTDRRRE